MQLECGKVCDSSSTFVVKVRTVWHELKFWNVATLFYNMQLMQCICSLAASQNCELYSTFVVIPSFVSRFTQYRSSVTTNIVRVMENWSRLSLLILLKSRFMYLRLLGGPICIYIYSNIFNSK